MRPQKFHVAGKYTLNTLGIHRACQTQTRARVLRADPAAPELIGSETPNSACPTDSGQQPHRLASPNLERPISGELRAAGMRAVLMHPLPPKTCCDKSRRRHHDSPARAAARGADMEASSGAPWKSKALLPARANFRTTADLRRGRGERCSSSIPPGNPRAQDAQQGPTLKHVSSARIMLHYGPAIHHCAMVLLLSGAIIPPPGACPPPRR